MRCAVISAQMNRDTQAFLGPACPIFCIQRAASQWRGLRGARCDLPTFPVVCPPRIDGAAADAAADTDDETLLLLMMMKMLLLLPLLLLLLLLMVEMMMMLLMLLIAVRHRA